MPRHRYRQDPLPIEPDAPLVSHATKLLRVLQLITNSKSGDL